MEYQVPQFIEVEDKIFGPLTWRQFIYVGGGIGLSVIIYLYLPFTYAVILIILVMGFTGALAFYKINDRSFVDILGAGFTYFTKNRLYLWRKEEKNPDTVITRPQIQTPPIQREKLSISSSKLHDLALSLDIQDKQDSQ